MTTIPYDEGWTIVVDGKEETPVKMLEGFIGVRLSPGEHLIEMNYMPVGLKPGIWISLASLVLMAFTAFAERMMRRKMETENLQVLISDNDEMPTDMEEDMYTEESDCNEEIDYGEDEPPSDIKL